MRLETSLTHGRLRAPRAAAIAGIVFSVLLIVTSTLALRTGFIARWIAFLGYGVALLLLLSGRNMEGVLLVFPLWVLLVSLYILASNMRATAGPAPGSHAGGPALRRGPTEHGTMRLMSAALRRTPGPTRASRPFPTLVHTLCGNMPRFPIALRSIPALLALALAPCVARASFFHGETLDSLANGLAIFILIAVPIGGIVLFWLVHILPEKVAEKRHHPQKDAIKTLCLLSLVFGGMLWPIAWLWAYSKPVVYKLAYGTDKHEDYYREVAEKESKEAGELAGEVAQMRQELGALLQRGARPQDLSAMQERLALLEARLLAVSAEQPASTGQKA